MLSIGVVARQTGIAIATLRKWEARYGFPQPQRRESGQRSYAEADVGKLLLITRRIAAGERVGEIMRDLNRAPRQKLAVPSAPPAAAAIVDACLAALCRNDVAALNTTLETALAEQTLWPFVRDIAAPLTERVGDYWAAAAYRVEVVGISASCHSAPRLLGAFINTLRNALPKRVELWCGGAGMRKILHIPPGVTVIDNLDQLKEVCGTTFARP